MGQKKKVKMSTVLQPVTKNPKHPHKPAGAFVLSVSITCLLLVLTLGISLVKLTSAPQSTHWQAKAAELKEQVAVRYPSPSVQYTSPEAIALKAEMDALRTNFARYAAAKENERQKVFAKPQIAEVPESKTPTTSERLTTGQLVGKITRTLLVEEADSFLNKVQMAKEVADHVQEVGF